MPKQSKRRVCRKAENGEWYLVESDFSLSTIVLRWGVGGGGGREDSYINVTGMLAISLRQNCRFWSHLFLGGMESHKGLCMRKFIKKAATLATQKSPLGVSLNLRFNFNFPTSIPVNFIGSPPGCRAWEAHALPSQHTTHSRHTCSGHESLHAVVLQPRPICCRVTFTGKINPKAT